jgi:hypothetical protein
LSGRFQGRRLSFSAPAVETDARKNAAFVPVNINHAVVAVHIHRRGTEDDEENKGGKAEEYDWKNHETAESVADRTAFFKRIPAVRAQAGSVGHFLFAFRAIDKRHNNPIEKLFS